MQLISLNTYKDRFEFLQKLSLAWTAVFAYAPGYKFKTVSDVDVSFKRSVSLLKNSMLIRLSYYA